MSTVTISHADIAAHWVGQRITPSGDISPDGDVAIGISMSEPSCWGCGMPILGKAELSNEKEFRKIWNDPDVRSRLERCHIVPESCGGTDAPHNMFLLCGKCHAQSPDTTNRQAFFRWIYHRNKSYSMGFLNNKAINDLIDAELRGRGFPTFREMFESLNLWDQEKWSDRITESVELRGFVQGNISSHWCTINHNSIVIAIVDWLLKTYNEIVLKGED